jgi:hypothetical protein
MRLPPPVNPPRRSLAAITTLLVVAGGCTRDPPREPLEWNIDPEPESPGASVPSIGPGVPGVPGRIAVVDERGNLITFDPDGSDVAVVAEAVAGESEVRQPTWSPSGDRIAWVRLALAVGGTTSVVTAAPDGTMTTETPTTVVPFYLSWDPTSSRIAYLGPSTASGIELGIADVTGAGEATAFDGGSPFYLSWNPSGNQLVVHVGGERLDRLQIDGTVTPVGDSPGIFNVPVWTSDGRSLVYASTADRRQRLVAHDLERGRAEELVRFDGAITFVVSPDGSRVAFQVLRAPNDRGPLSVLDRETGELERVAAEIVPAFFWSPDGGRLLYLLPEVTPDGSAWFRWGVWDGGSSFTTPRFFPTQVFARDYLQFFEQYAQSMTLWAPDGSAFTYAGTNESAEMGVWIQPASAETEPVLVTQGVFASWSPG